VDVVDLLADGMDIAFDYVVESCRTVCNDIGGEKELRIHQIHEVQQASRRILAYSDVDESLYVGEQHLSATKQTALE
jgi:hypothetical protein